MTERPIVSCEALAARLGARGLRVVDASWHLPDAGRDAAREFAERHVPGAVFFDIDRHSAPGDLPHMLPDADAFAAAAGGLGIAERDDIVVYDSAGLFSAARVRWMFRAFGAERVAILDGGLPAWIAAGHPLESGLPTIRPTRFVPAPDADAVASLARLRAAVADGSPRVLDARSPGRFAGTEPEPRPGLRAGHVPNSVNVPYTELLDDGRLGPNEALRTVFERRGVALDEPLVTSCGSGVTAAIVSLALECLGVDDVALYDGSWAEWGARDDVPVATDGSPAADDG